MRFLAMIAATVVFFTLSAVACMGSSMFERRPLVATRCTSPPHIDGNLSDPVWRGAARAETFVDRVTGQPAAEQAVALITYDDDAIYVAFDVHDSLPGGIVAREIVRDCGLDGDDRVSVSFDLFGTCRWDDLTEFAVNPIGTRSARHSGGRAGKVEWNGEWDAAARRSPTGWTAEMRIPWQALSYPTSKALLDVGINFGRYHQRTHVDSVWSNTGPNGFLELQGQWKGVRPPTVAFRPQTSVLPYVYTHAAEGSTGIQTGLDTRVRMTPQLTAVATVNPDFASIEGAVEGIAFSRAERYVDERRPFFLEGRDYLQIGDNGAFGPHFYSNRIERVDFGAKVFGKLAPADTIGLLQTVDYGKRADLVVRYNHSFDNTTNAGVFVNQKSATDDNNTVALLTGGRRMGKFGVGGEIGTSAGNSAGGACKQVNLTYEDKRNFTSVQYLDISPSFRNADGLIYFNDFRGLHLFHVWSAEWRSSAFRSFYICCFPSYDWHTDGSLFQRNVGVDMGVEMRSDWRFSMYTGYADFEGQVDATSGFSAMYGASNRFRRAGVSLNTGRLGSEPTTSTSVWASYRVLRKLDVGYNATMENRLGSRAQHIVTFGYEMSPTRSWGGRLVCQEGSTNWYVSYRNAGGRGTETYVIVGDPNASRFQKQLSLKFVFAL